MTRDEITAFVQQMVATEIGAKLGPELTRLRHLLSRVYWLEREAFARGEPFLSDGLATAIQEALGDPDAPERTDA